MLERFFVVPAAVRRLRSCVLGVHLDAFCAQLVGLGYRQGTLRSKLWVVAGLARWMADEDLATADLNESRVDEFLATRRRQRGTSPSCG